VDDEVTNSYQGVANVPAVVGLPAAMITGIGHWLAQNIATSFGVDPMLSVSGGTGGGAGGGFNIFGDMMEDANNFTITSPELKNSLAAFTGDCVVAELGMQLMTPTQMESSANLWQDMGKVIPQGVMNRLPLLAQEPFFRAPLPMLALRRTWQTTLKGCWMPSKVNGPQQAQ
jgi:hypothetical protein